MDAGYASNWAPDLTLMTKETADTNIYSVVLELKAFKKYEYKFLNGDQSYEAEFVPDASRVGYDFNDNRWIYTDSLKNDTFFVGAIPFAGNAPLGTKLIRFKMKLKAGIALDANGVHVAGDFQGWDSKKNILYSLKSGIYEAIQYVKSDTVNFKYYNGSLAAGVESVPASCAVNGNRRVVLLSDSVLPTVCFSECTNCAGAGIDAGTSQFGLDVFPNPSRAGITVSMQGKEIALISMFDAQGRLIYRENPTGVKTIQLDAGTFPATGLYFISCTATDGMNYQSTLVIQ